MHSSLGLAVPQLDLPVVRILVVLVILPLFHNLRRTVSFLSLNVVTCCMPIVPLVVTLPNYLGRGSHNVVGIVPTSDSFFLFVHLSVDDMMLIVCVVLPSDPSLIAIVLM